MREASFRLKHGQLLKEEIEARTKDVRAGVVLSLVAGLETAVLRMAGATPDRQEVKTFQGPLEIVSGTGTVSPDGCHIHVSVSDASGNVFGGHLKDGCIVATTAEVVLGIFDDIRFVRAFDESTGFNELEIRT